MRVAGRYANPRDGEILTFYKVFVRHCCDVIRGRVTSLQRVLKIEYICFVPADLGVIAARRTGALN